MNDRQSLEERRRFTADRLDSVALDHLCNDVGGHFRATSLMQKRLRDLIRFSPDANRTDNKVLMAKVIDEIGDEDVVFQAAEDAEDEDAAAETES
jgi:hypothetical protein